MEKLKYPRGEHVWVGYYDLEGRLRFIVTSKEGKRDYYFLYECVDGTFRKLGRSRSPRELEERFDVDAKVRGKGPDQVE